MAVLDNDDMRAIKSLMIETIIEKVEDGTIASGESVSHLPSKSEFFGKMDEVVGELKKSRENTEVLTQHSRDHSDELEKLKKIHPKYKHSFA